MKLLASQIYNKGEMGELMMKKIALSQFAMIASLFYCGTANSGDIAKELGLYLADTSGNCKTSDANSTTADYNIVGVCVSPQIFSTIDTDYIRIGIAELTDPSGVEIAKRVYAIKQTTQEAYTVEIKSTNGDTIELQDGAIIQRTFGDLVGYASYGQSAILYYDTASWNLCVNGKEMRVEILKEAQSSYYRDRLRATINEIEEMKECS
jgi:hypothetical protein